MWICPTDLWCKYWKHERYRENIGDKKLSVEHILHAQPEGYMELHEVVSQSSPLSSPSLGFELRTFQFCVLCAIPLCQPPHMKNKKNNIWKLRILLRFTQLEPISEYFQGPQFCTQTFLDILIHLHFVYLNGTDQQPLWLWAMLERSLEFRVSRLA